MIINLLRDQLVSRELNEKNERIQEFDVWFEGTYLGTITKTKEQYVNTLNRTVRYSLVGALLEFIDEARESQGPSAIFMVPDEKPESTIFKVLRDMIK